ncbi:carbamoyl-phosphate synthase large subunit [Oikeobacillus pervagus]|uniref:Carbamoyl phosphate synthase arginine-specific large chain n=1 Tax=Oikeobacillus pervagus TaxID=1325931 RepID=A0AAJ1SZN2_9BACI|nr:carbamoyl phosphate synthase large subunit [Oikeobacillus pervagus]MDQ0215594.1 carbamoyl-phosphate synthase large subunit [Oikeobacillus pervagus]
MTKRLNVKKILVIGSGPIVIGQAAEFDYAGTQACMALKEDGYEVILVNNNPATIMTDEIFADAIYCEPLTVETVEKIIQKERPDALLATFGGQTGLNLAKQLSEQGIVQKYGVKVIGTSIDSIQKGEDRSLFRQLMVEIGEPVPESSIVSTAEEAIAFANDIGYPVIIRPAYTLGGTGGGFAHNEVELKGKVEKGLKESPIHQCLIERSIAGWKEVEYEVMRDASGTCITICNMENIDPVGIHTGDSIVVAPVQTLTHEEQMMLKTSAIKIISALEIIGGCNIQFALHPDNQQYYLIEVNPRVSRSSALASKATGYPIAWIAAKLSTGWMLDQLKNPVTQSTFAHIEPTIDYIALKFPRWPFDKFQQVDRKLTTQMKATGEIMAVDRTFERAIQKAVVSLEGDQQGLILPELKGWSKEQLLDIIVEADDRRFFALLEMLRKGESVEFLHSQTKIDLFFLNVMKSLIDLEREISGLSLQEVSKEQLFHWKQKGFSDEAIAALLSAKSIDVTAKRKEFGIIPSYKNIDTCAGLHPSASHYYYSTYGGKNEQAKSDKEKVLIIGSGPIRIGQGIEFDYCSVHGVMELKEAGYETIMINNNPETVSTDFVTADRLYFEPLTLESVMDVIEAEGVDKVIVQLGGQTAISLAHDLERAGLDLLGTTGELIDLLEDRQLFYQLLDELKIPHIEGDIAESYEDLMGITEKIPFPILIRPSYVIGGKGMHRFYSKESFEQWLNSYDKIQYPVLVDRYLPGKEVEADILCDGEQVSMPAIIEHIEKAGIHSGDSMAILPAVSLKKDEEQKIFEYAQKLVKKLSYKGIMNIQYVLYDGVVYVLEVNPRASRTVPLVSKVCGMNAARESVLLMTGKKQLPIASMPIFSHETDGNYAVKYPVFSNFALQGLDTLVGPEMKATGEGIAFGKTVEEALHKIFLPQKNKKPYGKELYCLTDEIDKELLKNAEHAGLAVVTDVKIKEWTKKEEAFVFYAPCEDEKSKVERMIAEQSRMLTFTEKESLMAFLSSLHVTGYEVAPLQQWKMKKPEVMKL